MPQYTAPRLTISQREELMARVVQAAGGRVTLTAEGKKTQFILPGRSPYAFTGRENIRSVARQLNVDIMDMEPSKTKFDGVGFFQAREKLAESILLSIQETTKNRFGLVGFENTLAEKMEENQVGWSIVGDTAAAWSELLNIGKIRQSLIEQQEMPYDKNRQKEFIEKILNVLDTAGVTVYLSQETPRLNRHVGPSLRQSMEDPYQLTDMSGVHDALLKAIQSAADNRRGTKHLLTQVHGMMYTRNVALGTTDHPDAIPELLSPYTGKLLLKAYQSATRGQQEAVESIVKTLVGKEHPLTHSYVAKDSHQSILEHLHRRHRLLETLLSARREFSSLPEIELHHHEYSTTNIRERLLSGLSSEGALDDTLMLMSSLEKWVKPTLYDGNEETRRALVERTKVYMEQQEQLQKKQDTFLARASRLDEKAFSIYATTVKTIGVVKSEFPDLHKKSLSKLEEALPGGRLPLGRSLDKVEGSLKELESDIVREWQEPGDTLLSKYKDEMLPIMEDVSQKNPQWTPVLSQLKEDPPITGDFKRQLTIAVDRCITSKMVEKFALTVALKIQQKSNQPTQRVESADDNTRSNQQTVEKDRAHENGSGAPDESSEETLQNAQASPSESTPSVAKKTDQSVQDTPESTPDPIIVATDANIDRRQYDALRKQLDELQEHLFELCFDKDGELIEPDALEWINKRWESLVGDTENITDKQLPRTHQKAFSAFDALASSKSRKKLNAWYLESVERSLLVERIESAQLSLNENSEKLIEDERTQLNNMLSVALSGVRTVDQEIPEYVDVKKLERLTQGIEGLSETLSNPKESVSPLLAEFKKDSETFLTLKDKWRDVAKESPEGIAGLAVHWDQAIDKSRWLDPEQRSKQIDALAGINDNKIRGMMLTFTTEESPKEPWQKALDEGVLEPTHELPKITQEEKNQIDSDAPTLKNSSSTPARKAG